MKQEVLHYYLKSIKIYSSNFLFAYYAIANYCIKTASEKINI